MLPSAGDTVPLGSYRIGVRCCEVVTINQCVLLLRNPRILMCEIEDGSPGCVIPL